MEEREREKEREGEIEIETEDEYCVTFSPTFYQIQLFVDLLSLYLSPSTSLHLSLALFWVVWQVICAL